MTYRQELAIALKAASVAARIQIESAANLGSVMLKEDRSPVTDVDKRCEAAIAETLAGEFPRDGFLGEESGNLVGQSGRRWIVDPLDGTRPYMRGIPTHSVLIALEDGDTPVVGVISLPSLSKTCWGVRGAGAFLDGQEIHVSTTSSASNAMGSALGFVEHGSEPIGQSLLALMRTWDYAYGFMDAFSYVCVASGKLDICVNLLDKPWDCAAGACIVQAAGGRFSDLKGRPSVHNGSIILSNGLLHEPTLAALARGGACYTGSG